MASTIVDSSSEFIDLSTDISLKVSPAESEDVVRSLKRIFGKPFDSVENEDLLSCLVLLHKLGYVSSTKLTLIREFVAPMSSKQKDICEMVDNFVASHLPQADPESELQGRSNDRKTITEKLKAGQPSVVNLHGSAGVGKTTLAKEICSKWGGKSYVFDLREAKDMRAIYFNIMNTLGLTVPVGYLSCSYVVYRICEHTVKDSDGQPVLFLFDNVDQFTLGQGKEGKNLRTAFMQFLGKLSEYDDTRKMRPLRVLLTSRTRLNDAQKVIDHELQPLKDSDSEKILLPEEMSDLNTELKEKLVAICNRKPLFLKGVRTIFQQKRKAPNDLIDELENLIHMANKEKADTPEKSKLEEDSKKKPFDLEQEGVDTSEQSVMKEMFSTLPSDSLKLSAVSISLFRGPFTAATAATVLGISPAEAVAQLEGLETSAIVFVVNREAKELMYDIHPVLRKYADSFKNDVEFAESYFKARGRFYEHFMFKMKTVAGFIESDYVEAFNRFTNDQPNLEFTIEISLLPEFFSVPGEFHDNVLIASLVHAMLSTEKQRELFHSWAEICPEDEKSGSLFRAQLRCWEARQMLDAGGPRKAFEVLQQAALSLEKVQDRTTESFQLTRGLYLYFEGEIYCQKKDYTKALECLHSSLDLIEKVLEVHTNLAKCYNAIGNCYYGLNKPEKALEFYTKALEMRRELSKGSEYHYDMPVYKNQIGKVYEDQQEYEKAVECYTDAIRLLEELKISGYEDEALFSRNLANTLLRQNKIQEAIIPAEKAYSIRSKLLGSHPDTVRSIFHLGVIQKILGDYEKALDRFVEAWEMEKSLEPGNHSAVWKLIMKGVNDMSNFLRDEYEGKELKETIREKKEKFEADALGFCKRFWKEERELPQFGFTEYNKDIIDTIMELLGDNEEGRGEYERETMWFYDGYQSATEADFYNDFEEKKDVKELNEMLDRRLEFLQEIVELSVRLDQHEKRVEFEEKKVALCRKALLKEETKRNIMARGKTIKGGILLLCKELKNEKLGRRYGKEALRFHEDLWTAQYDEMSIAAMKKFLREVKDLASSVGDFDRVKLYQDSLQKLIDTGDKPRNTLGQKESSSRRESESEEEEVIGDEPEEEIEMTSDQEIEVEAEQEVEEIEETSEAKSEIAGEFDDGQTIIHKETITKRGTHWNLKQVPAHVIFPPEAVSMDSDFTLGRWRPQARSPPLNNNEAIVSDVIELSADSLEGLHFNRAVTLVISHCASDLKGYEIVVKCLIDRASNEWVDLPETVHLRSLADVTEGLSSPSEIPDYILPATVSKITRCSTFVVVCRLKSYTHTVTFEGSELCLPEYPRVKVSFPQNAVEKKEEVQVIVKLQEVPQKSFKRREMLPGPILRITSPKTEDFLEPVTIQLPVSLSERKWWDFPDLSMVRVRIWFKESRIENEEWTEITEKLEKPPSFDGTVVSFSVRHFSLFWSWIEWCASSIPGLVANFNTESVRKDVSFAVYVPKDTRLGTQTKLRLYCTPRSKKYAMIDDENKLGNIMLDDGSSDDPMCYNDKAYVFLSNGIVMAVNQDRLQGLHVRLQEEPYSKNLKVRVVDQGELTVSFCRSQNRDEDNMLCELDVTLPPPSSDPDKTPVEFFGLPFNDSTLHEARFDGILAACRGVLQDIGKEDIYKEHLELLSIRTETAVMTEFVTALSKLPQQDQQKCFDEIVGMLEESPGQRHISDHLLQAQDKISKPITDEVRDVVAEKLQQGSCWKTLVRDLSPKVADPVIDAIEEEEQGRGKECCRVALKKWYQANTDQATIREVMRCLTNMGYANVNWHIMRELELVTLESMPESERS